jgi:hypothetical protein
MTSRLVLLVVIPLLMSCLSLERLIYPKTNTACVWSETCFNYLETNQETAWAEHVCDSHIFECRRYEARCHEYRGLFFIPGAACESEAEPNQE